MFILSTPVPLFLGRDGKPLEQGYVWLGSVSANPKHFPALAYWDESLSQPVPQPLRTLHGQVHRDGTPANVYTAGNFSLLVEDSAGIQVGYWASSAESSFMSGIEGRLASVDDANKGAGQVGFNPLLVYPPSSIGAAISWAVNARSFGALGDGVTDDSEALQAAFDSGKAVVLPDGNYRASNLTMATNGQHLIAHGNARLIKASNGPILTVSGNDCALHSAQFRGESSSPALTGDNLVITGDNVLLSNCGSRWAFGRAVKCTGQRPRILGSCDIYQTADTSATGYDIEVGTADTATLYGAIYGIQSTQSTGGILLTAPGFVDVTDAQFGKLTVSPGSSPAGMHGPAIKGCRITGATVINVSNTFLDSGSCSSSVTIGNLSATSNVLLGDTFSMISGSTLTFGLSASSNRCELDATLAGITVIDNGASNAVNRSPSTYSVAWDAATPPAIGNGSVHGDWAQEGRSITANITLTIGSTTTLGSGAWTFSLPKPRWSGSNAISVGAVRVFRNGVAFYVGTASVSGGLSVVTVTSDGGVSGFSSSVPFSWATGDVCAVSITYPAG